MLFGSKPPINEQPLEVPMAGAAGVQGVVGPLGEVVHATDAGVNSSQPVFHELTSLVRKPDIILRALVLAQISVIGTVPKPDRRTIGEGEAFVRFVILGSTAQHAQQWNDMVVQQLPEGLSGNENLDPGVVQGQQRGLPPDEPAFSAAPGAAVAHIAVGVQQCHFLLVVWDGHIQHNIIGHNIPGLPSAEP